MMSGMLRDIANAQRWVLVNSPFLWNGLPLDGFKSVSAVELERLGRTVSSLIRVDFPAPLGPNNNLRIES